MVTVLTFANWCPGCSEIADSQTLKPTAAQVDEELSVINVSNFSITVKQGKKGHNRQELRQTRQGTQVTKEEGC